MADYTYEEIKRAKDRIAKARSELARAERAYRLMTATHPVIYRSDEPPESLTLEPLTFGAL